MNQHFEQVKNRKAALYTLIAIIVVIGILLIRITLPVVQEPIVDNGIEVNLGNSDLGSGDIPPMVPGEPAPESTPQQTVAAPPATQPKVDEQEEEPDPEDKEPAITKTIEKVTKAEKPNKNPPIEKPEVVKEKPAPPQPKPKAQMGQYSGGKGPGGNNQDTYNGVKDQGITGGKGDQGKPNGNINSDNYKGNGGTGKSGIAITRGLTGRSITRYPSMSDDFNQNAKIAVDIKIDETGRVISAVYQPRGSTSSDASLKQIASRKALELKFNAGDDEGVGTIVFDFKVRN